MTVARKTRRNAAPPNHDAPSMGPDQVRALVRRRDEKCRPDCQGWDVFEVNREPGVEIQACDECNQLARTVGEPELADADVAQLPEARRILRRVNPALTDQAFVAEIQKLLLDPDPATVDAIQDMLLERTMTLSELSQRMAHTEESDWSYGRDAGWAGDPETLMGTFEVSRSSRDVVQSKPGPDTRAEGVAWYVARTSTGEKFFTHVTVHARDHEILIPTGERYKTQDEALKAAVVIAWRAVVALKQNRDRHLDRGLENAVREATATWSRIKIPREIVEGFAPVGPGDLKQNPPWVTSALADAFESLSSQVPPQWLPKLDDVRAGARNTLVGELREYGCGAYGCVLPTLDPAVVLKVTTDSTEAEFASQLAADLVAPICVEYFMAVSLAARHDKRPIYLLWREAADDVGQADKVIGVDAQHYIDEQHRAAQQYYLALKGAGPIRIVLKERETAWIDACAEMGNAVPELGSLAEGMLEVYRTQKIFFGDIHTGNLGRVFRGGEQGLWVITDPGHVAVIRA